MDLKKIQEFDKYDEEQLEKMHTEIHSIYTRVMNGTLHNWTLKGLYETHKMIWNSLIRAGGKHVAPVDSLDGIEIYEEDKVEKNYSRLEDKRSLEKIKDIVYKLADYIADLEGKKLNFLKLGKEKSIVAKVIAVHKVKDSENLFYYQCLIEGNSFVGKTSNTDKKIKIGDNLKVSFESLNQFTDPDTSKIWFNWNTPVVEGIATNELTSIADAKKIVKTTSGKVSIRKAIKISKDDLSELQEILSESGKVVKYNTLVKEKFKLSETKIDWDLELNGRPLLKLNKNPSEINSGIFAVRGRTLGENRKEIDSGFMKVTNESDTFMEIDFQGKKLKEKLFFIRRDVSSDVWNLSKTRSVAKLKENLGEPLSDDEKREIQFLSENKIGVSEIGKALGRPNSTIYSWKEKLKL